MVQRTRVVCEVSLFPTREDFILNVSLRFLSHAQKREA